MNNIPKIISTEFIEPYKLLVLFSNHQKKKYDFSKLFDLEPFSHLKEISLFKNVTVDQFGNGLVWNDEIDISEYEIWSNGESVN